MAKQSKGKPVAVDFTGVESGGGSARVKEGDYHIKIVKAVLTEAKSSGNSMFVFTVEIQEGKYKGKKLLDRAVLTQESLWKLKQILEAIGVNVPSKKVAIDVTKYIGEEAGVTVSDREHEGKTYSNITDWFPLDDLNDEDDDDEDDDEDEDEEPAPKKSKKSSKKKSKKDDDDEDVDEIDLDEI